MMAIGQTTLFSMPILQSVYESSAQEVMLYISTISIVFRIFVYIVAITVISGEKITIKSLGPQIKKVFFTPVMVGFSAPISVTLSIACMQYGKEEKMASRTCVISTLLTLITFPLSFVIVHFALQWMQLLFCNNQHCAQILIIW